MILQKEYKERESAKLNLEEHVISWIILFIGLAVVSTIVGIVITHCIR